MALATTGCFGAPSALAPSLRGSVGVPHHGVVTDAVALPKKGDGYVLFRNDGVRWGSPRLVRAIETAAASVSKSRPGPPLVIGDLGERYGGETSRHRSHRSGRDVDILFYVTTPSGVPLKSPGFIKFSSDGLGTSSGGDKVYRFDVERNWELVRSLLEDEDVQWVFVARPLEVLLVEHAMSLGEPLALVWKAQTVLRQPGDSAPHDDHFHLRLACSVEEMVAGCEGGPRWPWQAKLPELTMTDDELLVAILED
ncbi:MAG: murein endopeptidase [Polyangiaceae bacterium]|nr:murein endopeptidase [Polyangiaceae bacterium]